MEEDKIRIYWERTHLLVALCAPTIQLTYKMICQSGFAMNITVTFHMYQDKENKQL